MTITVPHKTHIPALRSLWQEAFGDTEEFLNAFFITAFHVDRCRCITLDEKLAAALYWFDCRHMGKRIAYLYAVATAKAYRRQGICHKLMKDTHLHLTKLGYEGTILVPGNSALFELYESMGYHTCSYIREFCCLGEANQISLRRIDKDEYARLRWQLLPPGGVVQEYENLDFLQTQVAFYAGSDFLLASREEAGTFYGVELLGNQAHAPGILHALGYEKGIFRTPGKDIPFAMHCPLGESTLPPPAYFGLAFD